MSRFPPCTPRPPWSPPWRRRPPRAWTPPTTLSTRRRGQPARAGRVRRQRPDRLAAADRARSPRASATPVRRSPPPTRTRRSGPAAWTRDGNAIVLTVRKHKPLQRIRATLVAADGTRTATRTISDNTHSAAQPTLAGRAGRHGGRRLGVARPGGLARAGRDPPPGPAALRRAADDLPARAGGRRTQPRPFVRVAAGRRRPRRADAGRSQTGERRAAARAHRGHGRRASAPTRSSPAAVSWADVSLAVGPAGAVQVAYLRP